MSEQTPHGEAGHVNIYVRDQDSDITGFGAHNRLLVFKDCKSGRVEVREDIRHGLPFASDAQVRKVLSGWQRMHPRGSKLIPAGFAAVGACTWRYYRVEVRA